MLYSHSILRSLIIFLRKANVLFSQLFTLPLSLSLPFSLSKANVVFAFSHTSLRLCYFSSREREDSFLTAVFFPSKGNKERERERKREDGISGPLKLEVR